MGCYGNVIQERALGSFLYTPSSSFSRKIGSVWPKFRESSNLIGSFSVPLNESAGKIRDFWARVAQSVNWGLLRVY